MSVQFHLDFLSKRTMKVNSRVLLLLILYDLDFQRMLKDGISVTVRSCLACRKVQKKNRLKDINRWGNSSNSAFPLRVSDASFSLGSCLELFSAQPWIRCVRSQSRTPFTAQWLAIHHLHSHRAAKPRPIPKRTNQRARSGRIRNMVSLRVQRVSEKFSWETNAFTKTYSESCLTR